MILHNVSELKNVERTELFLQRIVNMYDCRAPQKVCKHAILAHRAACARAPIAAVMEHMSDDENDEEEPEAAAIELEDEDGEMAHGRHACRRL